MSQIRSIDIQRVPLIDGEHTRHATQHARDIFVMNTAFLLMAQYNGAAVIPVASVVKDYFPHLTVESFSRKASLGEIKLAVIRIEQSNKSAKGVHLQDLADYIDARRKVAKYELEAFTG